MLQALEPVQAEIRAKLPGQHWDLLAEQTFGFIALHVINVLFRTVRDPLYQAMSE